jgi:hypothetical protein
MDFLKQAKEQLAQPLVGAPGQQTMARTFWPGDTSDPFKVLEQIDGVAVQEKVKGMEILTGFETGNRYIIKDLKTGADLFIAMELDDGMTGALQRNALSGGARGFNVKIGMLKGPVSEIPPERFATIERPFKCTCLWWNRPMSFLKNSRTGASLGGVGEPFKCCRINLVQFDDKGDFVAELDECCTSLICFGAPCFPNVELPIKRAGGQVVASIKKQFTGIQAVGALTGLSTDADHFTVHFQPGSTPEEKLQAIATTLFMDFAYFTKGGQEQRDGSAASLIGQQADGDEGANIGQALGFLAGAAAAYQQSQQPTQKVNW